MKDSSGSHKDEPEKQETDKSETSAAHITFDHVNVRHSIVLLLFKLVVIEIIATAGVIVFHSVLYAVWSYQTTDEPFVMFNIYVFIALALVKLLITAYVLVDWLDEYYEISTTEIGHRKGTFVKRNEKVKMEHLTSIRLEQGFLGRFFNYGTIKLHDWFRNRDYYLYQIHNPKRYEHVLTSLMPRADHSRKTIRNHIIEEEE